MSEYSATYNNKETGDSRKITVEYDLGANLSEASEKFGEDVVFSNFKAHATVSLQSRIRALAAQGLNDDEIQAKVSEWKVGVATRTRKSPLEKQLSLYEKMSEDERAAFLAKLKEMTSGK